MHTGHTVTDCAADESPSGMWHLAGNSGVQCPLSIPLSLTHLDDTSPSTHTSALQSSHTLTRLVDTGARVRALCSLYRLQRRRCVPGSDCAGLQRAATAARPAARANKARRRARAYSLLLVRSATEQPRRPHELPLLGRLPLERLEGPHVASSRCCPHPHALSPTLYTADQTPAPTPCRLSRCPLLSPSARAH